MTGSSDGTASWKALYWLILLGLLASFCIWQLHHLEGFSRGGDEGIVLMWGAMAQRGYQLYSEIWSEYPPLFTLVLARALDILGHSVAAGRTVVVFFAALGVLGVSLVAKEQSGYIGGLASALLLVITPQFFTDSRKVMADLPASSLTILSVAFALYYLYSGKRIWLALAGLLFSTGMMMKLVTASTMITLILIALSRNVGDSSRRWHKGVKDLWLLALAACLPVVVCLLLCDPYALYDRALRTYWQSRGAYPLDLGYNLRKIGEYLSDYNIGLVSLAAFAVLSLLWERIGHSLIMLSWLAITFISLLIHSPLRRHHLTLILFPLVVLGGIASARVWAILYQLLSKRRISNPALFVLALGALSLYIAELPSTVKADLESLSPPWDEKIEDAAEATNLIKAMTSPDDFIITDYEMIAFRAGRKVPPPLTEISSKRVRIGSLTAESLIALTRQYDPKAILFFEGRLTKFPTYVDWIKKRYRLAKWYSHDRQVYVPFDPGAEIQNPLQANLGDLVTFLGYSIRRWVIDPGEPICIILYWQAQREMETSYTVFTHLVDEEGKMWGQQDNVPMQGTHPTTRWQQADIILDEYEIAVETATPPGSYELAIGMYDLQTMERLPVFNENGTRVPQDRILLGEVRVVR